MNKSLKIPIRDVGTIKEYFKSIAIPVQVYAKDVYIENKNRDSYFKEIENSLLQNALIFVDPDTGLQPEKSKSTEKHLPYSEVRNLYKAMGEISILSIFHFWQRDKNKRMEDMSKKTARLYDYTNDMCISISDDEITFFLLSKDSETKRRLIKAVVSYKKEYENLYCGGVIL